MDIRIVEKRYIGEVSPGKHEFQVLFRDFDPNRPFGVGGYIKKAYATDEIMEDPEGMKAFDKMLLYSAEQTYKEKYKERSGKR